MGKIRTKIIGDEGIEKKQKEDTKKRIEEKKLKKSASAKVTLDKGKSVNAEKIHEEPKKEVEKVAVSSKNSKSLKSTKTPIIKVKPHGKKYQEVKKLVDKSKSYEIKDAVSLLKKLKTAKFDESVEIHMNVDETGLKGEIDLPHSTGKVVKVAVVSDALLIDIEKGKINFDILVTHPSFMPRLAKFAKVLGPKGLMPNPKAGTISTNPEEVVKKFSGGLLRWKTEPKFPLIHQMIGKISFDDKALIENAIKLLSSVGKVHILKAYLKSTMSPSIRLDIERI
jgi:large subunit ribosomal protein L1